MTKHQRILLIIVAMLLTAVGASARPGGPAGGGHGGMMFGPRFAEALDLSQQQQETVEAMMEEHRSGMVEIRKTLMRLRQEMHGLMLQDDPDADAIAQLVRDLGQKRTELQLARTSLHLAIREQLTDEQRDKMMLMKERGRGAGRGDRRDRPHCGADRGPRGTCDDKGSRRERGRRAPRFRE